MGTKFFFPFCTTQSSGRYLSQVSAENLPGGPCERHSVDGRAQFEKTSPPQRRHFETAGIRIGAFETADSLQTLFGGERETRRALLAAQIGPHPREIHNFRQYGRQMLQVFEIIINYRLRHR